MNGGTRTTKGFKKFVFLEDRGDTFLSKTLEWNRMTFNVLLRLRKKE